MAQPLEKNRKMIWKRATNIKCSIRKRTKHWWQLWPYSWTNSLQIIVNVCYSSNCSNSELTINYSSCAIKSCFYHHQKYLVPHIFKIIEMALMSFNAIGMATTGLETGFRNFLQAAYGLSTSSIKSSFAILSFLILSINFDTVGWPKCSWSFNATFLTSLLSKRIITF